MCLQYPQVYEFLSYSRFGQKPNNDRLGWCCLASSFFLLPIIFAAISVSACPPQTCRMSGRFFHFFVLVLLFFVQEFQHGVLRVLEKRAGQSSVRGLAVMMDRSAPSFCRRTYPEKRQTDTLAFTSKNAPECRREHPFGSG